MGKLNLETFDFESFADARLFLSVLLYKEPKESMNGFLFFNIDNIENRECFILLVENGILIFKISFFILEFESGLGEIFGRDFYLNSDTFELIYDKPFGFDIYKDDSFYKDDFSAVSANVFMDRLREKYPDIFCWFLFNYHFIS